MGKETIDLWSKAKTDTQIRNNLIEENLKLVHYIAHKYYEDFFDYDDLIQEGTIGLIDAIENYNPDLGPFCPYAIQHIKKSISRAISNKNNFVKIPVETQRLQVLYKKFAEKEYMITGTMPTKEKIKEKLKVSSKRLDEIERLRFNIKSFFESTSNPDNNLRLIDIIPSEEPNTEDGFFNIYLREIIEGALTTLNERETEILKLRYGFYDRIYTQAEIAKQYNCSKSYICSIERKALEKLRRLEIFNDFIDYANNPDETKTFLQGKQNLMLTPKK